MLTYGKALKSMARTHANVDVHRLMTVTTPKGREVSMALCSSNLDGMRDEALVEKDVTCVKCLKTIARQNGGN